MPKKCAFLNNSIFIFYSSHFLFWKHTKEKYGFAKYFPMYNINAWMKAEFKDCKKHVAIVREIHHPIVSILPRVGTDYQVIGTEQITAI